MGRSAGSMTAHVAPMVLRGSPLTCMQPVWTSTVKRLARSMKRQGLEGLSTRSFRKPGHKTQAQCRHEDLCERTWDHGRLNAAWITDFTYLRCGEGWVYLCAIRDGHSRRVIGHSMGPKQATDLVVTALTNARAMRGHLPEQVILHADRGAQFTSHQLDEAAREVGVRMSMGKTGVCWDNAMAESFWATLKVEYFYRHAFAIVILNAFFIQ